MLGFDDRTGTGISISRYHTKTSFYRDMSLTPHALKCPNFIIIFKRG